MKHILKTAMALEIEVLSESLPITVQFFSRVHTMISRVV